jgi:hypothetical protein
MAIDTLIEQLISLSDAAKTLPVRRQGKRPHLATLYRWTSRGCRGVILESVQIGATRCTSKEALARFFHQLTAANGSQDAESKPAENPAKRRKRRDKEKKAAAKECDEAGIC